MLASQMEIGKDAHFESVQSGHAPKKTHHLQVVRIHLLLQGTETSHCGHVGIQGLRFGCLVNDWQQLRNPARPLYPSEVSLGIALDQSVSDACSIQRSEHGSSPFR